MSEPMASVAPSADLSRLESIYRERWEKHGLSPLSLGWTKGKQQLRFKVLLSDFACEGKSFLDVGCGFGDLNLALCRRASNYKYFGLDMVREFIEQAKCLYAGSHISFACGDFLSIPHVESVDYVVSSGIFAFRLSEVDNYEYIRRVLAKMLSVSREAVSVDFLSDRVNFRRDQNFYASPERVLSLCLALTKNVKLRHDYMPFEFAVTLYKDDSYSDSETIFRKYANAG